MCLIVTCDMCMKTVSLASKNILNGCIAEKKNCLCVSSVVTCLEAHNQVYACGLKGKFKCFILRSMGIFSVCVSRHSSNTKNTGKKNYFHVKKEKDTLAREVRMIPKRRRSSYCIWYQVLYSKRISPAANRAKQMAGSCKLLQTTTTSTGRREGGRGEGGKAKVLCQYSVHHVQ
jgi:hypothetical protein